jgi:hypothetical protein
MKFKNMFKMAFYAGIVLACMQACSSDEELVDTEEQEDSFSWSVRPEFIDTRPESEIATATLTSEDAFPVELKAGGRPDRPSFPDSDDESVDLSFTSDDGKYAVVIGISDYEGTINDLTYCDEDAEDWVVRLEEEGYEVITLIDSDATSDNIQDAIEELASLSVSGNEVAFAYSGHGSSGSIISQDFDYIDYSWFTTTFENSTSEKMFFTFDACQIGAMSAIDAEGRVVAVASDEDTYSYDGDSSTENGVFTYYQMLGFDSEGYIYVEDDCDYAVEKFESWSSQYNIDVAPSYTDSYDGYLDL